MGNPAEILIMAADVIEVAGKRQVDIADLILCIKQLSVEKVDKDERELQDKLLIIRTLKLKLNNL